MKQSFGRAKRTDYGNMLPMTIGLLQGSLKGNKKYRAKENSYSETILTRIEMVLGRDALGHLSTTDIWLLLSEAYYHDVGMALMANDIDSIFNAQKFFIRII